MNRISFPAENRIKNLIKELGAYREIEAFQSKFGILHEEEGQILQMLIEISNAQNVLEIGTRSGASALWMARGLLKTGGRLTTIENFAERIEVARENFKKAGVENIITLLAGGAQDVIPLFKEKFDFVYSDANKEQNLIYFELFMPLVAEGGIIIAHDSICEKDKMEDYLTVVKDHPQLDTVIVATANSQTGMAISYKKKCA